MAQARAISHRFAARAGWPLEAQENLALIVSELVTNACRHAPGPCRIRLQALSGRVAVEVWDTNPLLPCLSIPDTDVAVENGEPPCGGYGLGIVARLSEELLGFAGPAGGKTIRAVVTGSMESGGADLSGTDDQDA
ncbi:ATP-binding protein [Streptomyces sp. NPDC051776]|uniref:ATP-binding protein n=1 Tax=Streptomyces sp. NPDC051776 TaxID=3155414 RepID=UPI0034269955